MIKYIVKAKELGIIKGQHDSKGRLIFRPNDPTTRAEALAMLFAAAKISIPDTTKTDFTDIPKDGAWMIKYIVKAKELGIIKGQHDSKGRLIFRPNDSISRAETAKIVVNLLKYLKTLKG